MTEQLPSDDGPEAERVARFYQGSRNLMTLADTMLKNAPPGFEALDVASMFLNVGIKCLVASLGVAGVASYLRSMATGIEAETPRAN